MGVNRLTGINNGFSMDLFKSVDNAVREENKRLIESEQDLANEPTQQDFDNDAKASKEAKKQEIENKMESIIDAMHNTQIDSEEAKALASEFQELQSELAKLELEECPLNIKEEEMKFAEEFCSKCGAKLDAEGKPEKLQDEDLTESKVTDYIDADELDGLVKNCILMGKPKEFVALENMVLEVTTDMGKSFYKVVKSDDGKFEAYQIDKSGKALGDSFVLKECDKANCELTEGNIFADNSNTLNQLLDRATSELEGDELFELLQGMVDRIKEVADTCGLMVESEDSDEYKFKKGDIYQNEKGARFTIVDLDDKGQVTYKDDNGKAECVQLDSAINMLMKNGYKKVKESIKEDSYEDTFFSDIESALVNAGFDVTRFSDAGVLTKNIGWVISNEEGEVQLSCDGTWLDEGCKKDKITETEVKNIKPIKQQGNVFMLEDEDGKVIVGEDFNEEDGLIQNAEVYENKEEADKDYMKRCDIVKTESEEVKECDEPLPDDKCDKPKKKLADYAKRK